ncbi:NADH-quinone oxidoreductase subunit C [Embleya sp. NBC_00888]|uniref:NADH-quinone oxidoreductase subunit C n=1 Tax=Embleya sp. NBC_00888 TaxID=2975960 RepID=UPI003867BB06|nr:NADH-quinone oxidoreductase subunit C [Embleya sp. NBC_00888]
MTPEEIRAGLGEELVLAVSDAYGLVTVDVAARNWAAALTAARDVLGCAFFDWLTGVDELAEGFDVVAHVCAIPTGPRLLLRTRVPREAAVLASVTGVYAGARWHERETHEMFGIDFTDHPGLDPLLLPDGFEGHPLRKEFVLAARVAKAWPGAKEPGESDHGGGPGRSPGRRRTLPPGVPDPATWGPHKEEAAAEAAAAAEERPRRARGAAAGSASQAGEGAPPARRTRSVSQGSASQAGAPPAEPAAPEPASPEPPATDSTPPAEPASPAPAAPAEPAARPEPTTPSASDASPEAPSEPAAPDESEAPDESTAPGESTASPEAPAVEPRESGPTRPSTEGDTP